MRSNTPTHPVRVLVISMLALLSAVAFNVVHAQQFENTYGNPQCSEEAVGGAQPILNSSGGGYITVGNTFGCAASDIYLVKTSNAGGLVWTATFDIGGSDSAYDIQECANGDFIICGTTANTGSGCNSNDAFLLRVSSTGAFIWTKTYGTSQGTEVGYDVVEATVAAGNGTAAGDFVLVGTSTLGGKSFLLRTSSIGTMLWNATYDGGRLTTVDECSVGAGAGDIIAAGLMTGSPLTPPFPSGGVIRVNGGTGAIGASPQGMASFSLPLCIVAFNSIQELANGDIALAGRTACKLFGREIYLLRIGPDPCQSAFVDRKYGDNGPLNDEAFCIRETSSGDLVVTGYANLRNVAFGTDAFLMKVSQANLGLTGFGIRLFGDSATDVGRSVVEVAAAFPQTSPGFLIGGVTQSPAVMLLASDTQQMYLIKTDASGETSCNYTPTVLDTIPNATRTCLSSEITSPLVECTPNLTSGIFDFRRQRCLSLDGTCGCSTRRAGSENDGVAGVELSLDGDDALTTYPNPVVSGEMLSLEYTLADAGAVSISVSDVAGQVVFIHRSDYPAGRAIVTVNTDHWSSGVYIIKVDVRETTSTRKIVVMEK